MKGMNHLPLRSRVIWRMLKTALKVRPGAVILYFIGAFVEIAFFLTAIYTSAKIGSLLASYLTGGIVATSEIWFWLIIDIVAVAFIGLGFWLMSYGTRLLYFSMVKWSTITYLSKLCELDFPDFYEKEMRNRINKIDSGYSWQMANLSSAILDLIYGIVRFIAITAVVAQIGWWLVPVIIIFLIPSLLGESRIARISWFVWDSKGDERHIFWTLSWILKQPKNQLEIRSSQLKTYLTGKVKRMSDLFYNEQEKAYKHANKYLVPAKFFEVMGTAIGSVILLRRALAKSISLEQYFFLSGALIRVGGAINAIFGTATRMQEQLLFAEGYFELIDKPVTQKDIAHSIQLSSGQTPSIKFENVSFSYPGQTQKVFENFSLEIKANEHLAIVGENGAGKSTLIKLLLRFYQPDEGRILINGHDLQEISIATLYGMVATLFQDFVQYPFPIKENIELARASNKSDNKAFKQAVGLAGVDELVAKYKDGWETVLDASFKKGIEPSGGQWQKVALARAFYRDARLLILDEPTAAIDAKTEYEIFNNIFEHYKNKTTIIISHRFSTVRRADRIVVIDDGKIVEQGSHTSLMKNKNLYHEMFSKQAEGYR